MNIFKRFKNWVLTPPNDNDFFLVGIRKDIQTFFKPVNLKCNHTFEHPEYFVHGESHGKDRYRRECTKCHRQEYMIQRRFSKETYSWIKRDI